MRLGLRLPVQVSDEKWCEGMVKLRLNSFRELFVLLRCVDNGPVVRMS